jgi:hypothetical protein
MNANITNLTYQNGGLTSAVTFILLHKLGGILQRLQKINYSE